MLPDPTPETTPVNPVAAPAGEAASARRTRTRARLIDAGYELFAERGVAAASVEEISERAGFTRGAFYSNFESKWGLFRALAEREYTVRLDRLRDGVDAVLRSSGDGRTLDSLSIADIVRLFLSMQPDDRRWCLMQLEFRLMGMRDEEVAAVYRDLESVFRDQLNRQLSIAVELVGLEFVVSVEDAVDVLVNTYERALQEELLQGSENPASDATARCAEIIARLVEGLTVPVK